MNPQCCDSISTDQNNWLYILHSLNSKLYRISKSIYYTDRKGTLMDIMMSYYGIGNIYMIFAPHQCWWRRKNIQSKKFGIYDLLSMSRSILVLAHHIPNIQRIRIVTCNTYTDTYKRSEIYSRSWLWHHHQKISLS